MENVKKYVISNKIKQQNGNKRIIILPRRYPLPRVGYDAPARQRLRSGGDQYRHAPAVAHLRQRLLHPMGRAAMQGVRLFTPHQSKPQEDHVHCGNPAG